MSRFLVAAVCGPFALVAACRAGKSDDPTPSAATSASAAAQAQALAAEGGTPPAGMPRKLCTDGLHRAGEHGKNDCNPCRCGMDGEIICTDYPCPPRPEAGAKLDGGPKP
jgi:hypothetical protein